MNGKIAIVFLAISHFALAQKSTEMTKEKSNLPKTDKLVVYQIYTRLFGNLKTNNKFYGSIEENGCGKFNDINDNALQELKKFGVSHVWFTGVIEHATMTDYSKSGIPQDNPLVVKGIAGSPYAIKDYYDVDPDLAVDVKNRMKEFEALVKRSHTNGLKVIIDCVPNHVARSYHSDKKPKGIKDFGEEDDKTKTFDADNNFYYIKDQMFVVPSGVNPPVIPKENYTEIPAKATGNDVFSAKPSINDWFETIKLNYGVDYLNNRSKNFERNAAQPIPSTWLKMRDILTYWTKKGVDGFRCDMAEMVPFEFWGWVIPEIKKVNPEVIFIAEIYNPQTYKQYLFEGKFDYLYDKVGLYDALRRLMEGHGNANDISRVWQNESGDFSNRMLRFLENHDEQRIASKNFANDPFKAIPSMVVSAALHTGPVMLYFGQEVGVKPTVAEGFSGEDGRTTMFDYWGVPEFQNWVNNHQYDGEKLSAEQKSLRKIYYEILKFTNENEAVKDGKFYDLQYVNGNGQTVNYNDQKIYSYLRFTNNQRLLFICNFDLENSYSTGVFIPQGAWEMMKININEPVSYSVKEVFEKNMNSTEINQQTKSISTKEAIRLTLPANSVTILEIR